MVAHPKKKPAKKAKKNPFGGKQAEPFGKAKKKGK